MTTQKKASQAGARRVTATLDSMASLFQHHAGALGIPQKVAMDFAYRCDLLSDNIDKRRTAGYFDPSEIGTEKPGPMEYDTNNPFMVGEFTREEFRNLSEKQMAGELAANAAKHVADPKLASMVGKAVYASVMKLAALKKAEEKTEEEKDEKEADEGKKEEEVAKKAAAHNAARRAAKKSEEEDGDEDDKDEGDDKEPEAEKSEEETEEASKTAKLFHLYR